jgi:hypothetical protein
LAASLKKLFMAEDKLYTFHVDFRGGTYCTQVNAKKLDESLSKWIEKIKIEKNEIKYLGDKIIKQLEDEIRNPDNKPVLLTGLINVWCTFYSTRKGIFDIYIVQTEK